MKPYDHKKIEKKWQKEWESKKAYKTLSAKEAQAEDKKPYYVLDMFPYPSGSGLHVGHPRGYIASDVFARVKRMQGFNVLHPMGFDSFGLPAEQYAIQTGKNPGPFTNELVKRYREQLSILGFSYDWDRQVATHDPEYYKWTQWVFLQIYNSWYDEKENKARPISELVKIFEETDANWKNLSEKEQQDVLMNYRLVYEGYATVNWCEEMGTVLANDEVVEKDGKMVSERGEFPVVKKQMRQWFMRITAYADRLLAGLETIDWPHSIKEIQKNWIGKSEGSEIDFSIQGSIQQKYLVFDFDGVLGDTLKESVQATVMMGSEKNEQDAYQRILKYLSSKPNHHRGADQHHIDANNDWTFRFGAIMADLKPKLFSKFVQEIAKINHAKVAIVSAGSNDYILPLIQEIKNMGVHPTHVLTLQDHHSKEEKIEIICKDWGVSEKDVYYFTDSKADIYELETICDKSKIIGCAWGHMGHEPLLELIPEKQLLRNFSDIHKLWSDKKITVFTTRADTLFGVMYVVLAPEHELVQSLKSEIKNWSEVEEYIKEVKSKSDEDRAAAKEKTGIFLEGVFAINPANNEQVPVWVADYVLASYGTGAVMAVPAHDERDFEFAKKYQLPIKQVIEPVLKQTLGSAAFRENEPVQESQGIIAVIKHWTDPKYLGLHWPEPQWGTWLTGGIDGGLSPEETVYKEILEETGYKNAKIIASLGMVHSRYYHAPKKINRFGHTPVFLVELINDERTPVEDFEKNRHQIKWLSKEEMKKFLTGASHLKVLELLDSPLYTDEGMLTNSGNFNGLESREARKAITEFVGGKLVTKYKMRDAIFARQRYWGEPIPLIHGKDGVITSVPEKDLPLELPKVKSYAPAGDGQSPLATVSSWVKAGYETNTMPGWAGSSWYFLRYTDPKNKKKFADEAELDYWFGENGGVNMYVGGAEHATGHLLYSRFWHKVLKDLGYVKTEEPFQALRNQGMIGGADGRKMSKRWGNVINPDDVVRDLGADTMRVYETFMGPFEAHLPWSIDGIVGSRRFIERVWRLQEKISGNASALSVQKSLHKMIKKVTDDIAMFGFNTAVSAMMIFINVVEKEELISKEDFSKFLQILAPFAPHISDELWQLIGNKGTIHHATWPEYDTQLIIEESITMGIQVNGKVRAEIVVANDATEEDVKNMVLQIPEIQKWTEGKEIKKFIFIPKKIISIVVA